MKYRPVRTFATLAFLGLNGIINSPLSTVAAQGTAFTYQGRLDDTGICADGFYNFQFSLYGQGMGGIPLYNNTTTTTDVLVSNGLFAVTLDFGPDVFNGTAYWLDTRVATNTQPTPPPLVELSPRLQILATPYAIYAESAGKVANGAITAGQLGTTGGPPTSGEVLSYDGTSLIWEAPPGADAWLLTGNVGTSPANFLGTTDDEPLQMEVHGQMALRLQPTANGIPNIIGGGLQSFVNPGCFGDVIAGGLNNFIQGDLSAIGGGWANEIDWMASNSVIAGGYANSLQTNAPFSFIGAGQFNSIGSGGPIGGKWDVIGGGSNNAVFPNLSFTGGGGANLIGSNADCSVIAGGYNNVIVSNSFGSFIGGGVSNSLGSIYTTFADYGTVGGGFQNNNAAGLPYAIIAGGYQNDIEQYSQAATISGGQNNTNMAEWTVIGGGLLNSITLGSDNSTIGGGMENSIQNSYCAIAGGFSNVIFFTEADAYALIGGGFKNGIGAGGVFGAESTGDTIAGGFQNNILANSPAASISGGRNNNIQINSPGATIAGGQTNSISSHCQDAAIAGGQYNIMLDGSSNSFIGGGFGNSTGYGAGYATVGGGQSNSISEALFATVAGGQGNYGGPNGTSSSGNYGAIPGGQSNSVIGNFSFAAGRQAIAQNDGSFVWADNSGFLFNPYLTLGIGPYGGGSSNTFNVRSTGGFYIATSVGSFGQVLSGMYLGAGDSGWNTLSDRNAKTNFVALDAQDILERLAKMPVLGWNYKSQHDASVRHIGPMAQDFNEAFGVGQPDKAGEKRFINSVDEEGVALAAIQGLNQKLEETAKAKDATIQLLEQRLERLEQRMENPDWQMEDGKTSQH
ncbi:conserved exported hypothetical protein [Verrucomicrobia bacterium]|nr:conserved exported hypothetical protein [Verrucomicrobiota bacterium]